MRNPVLDTWGTTTETTRTRCSRSVQADGPVHEVTLADGRRAWLIVRHEEAKAALSHTGLSKDMHAALARDGAVVAEGLPGPAFARHMLSVDPPDHTRLRRLDLGRVQPTPDRGPSATGRRRSPTGCSTTSRRAATPSSTWSRASPSRCRSP